MPPKKKKRTGKKKGAVKIHDINLMTRVQLKYYVKALEKELKTTQREFVLFSTEKDRIDSFVEQDQEKVLQCKKLQTTKDLGILDQTEKLNVQSRKFDREFKFRDVIHGKQIIPSDFGGIQKGIVEKKSLKEIRNKERTVAEEKFFSELVTRDMMASDCFSTLKTSREEILFEYALKFQNAMENFTIIKQRILNDIWDFDYPIQKSKLKEMEKMYNYFHDLQLDTRKAIQKLKQTISHLQEKLEGININLTTTFNENTELKKKIATSQYRINVSIYHSSSKAESDDSVLDHLAVLNGELVEKHSKAEKEYENTKKAFIMNARKIYRTAEFKAFVAEEILRIGLAIKETKAYSERESKQINQVKAKNEHLRSKVSNPDMKWNLVNLNFQYSDTLFVPPRYPTKTNRV